jgi:hypothetical protein
MKKEIYPKYITKVKIKPKYTTSENIIFYAFSFLACFILLYTLCYILALIDIITL